jgi:hypothetical protein
MKYYQLQAYQGDVWKPIRYYKAEDFRALLNHIQPTSSQRLRVTERPATNTVVWTFTGTRLIRWVAQ